MRGVRHCEERSKFILSLSKGGNPHTNNHVYIWIASPSARNDETKPNITLKSKGQTREPVEEGNPLPFDDGCNIMYVNGQYKGDDALGKLMHDFSTPNADEMYYTELAEKVRFYKQDKTGVQMASKIVEEYGDERAAEALKQGIQQGVQQGLQQKAEKTAINMLKKKKYSVDEIAELTELTVEKVLELKNQTVA